MAQIGSGKPGEKIPVPAGMSIQEFVKTLDTTLAERGNRYGDFATHAHVTQKLKRVMVHSPKWDELTVAKKESLEMIVHKIGRILNGDPTYRDSWTDIAGYARLIERDDRETKA